MARLKTTNLAALTIEPVSTAKLNGNLRATWLVRGTVERADAPTILTEAKADLSDLKDRARLEGYLLSTLSGSYRLKGKAIHLLRSPMNGATMAGLGPLVRPMGASWQPDAAQPLLEGEHGDSPTRDERGDVLIVPIVLVPARHGDGRG